MKKIEIPGIGTRLTRVCCGALVLLSSQTALAQEEAFSPYLAFEFGLSANEIKDTEISGVEVGGNDDFGALNYAISYQFTPEWHAELGYRHNINTSGHDIITIDEDNSVNVGVDLDTKLLSLQAGYTYPLTNVLKLGVHGGMVYASEDIVTSYCQNSSFSVNCYQSEADEVISDDNNETSYIIGASVRYDVFDSFGIRFNYNYSGYQEGLTMAEFMLQFRF